MQVTVELPDYFDDEDGAISGQFAAVVVQAVAKRFEKGIAEKVTAAIEQRVEALVNEITEARIADEVERLLRDGFQETDSYGSARGPKKTVGQIIIEMLTKKDQYSSRYNDLPSIVSDVVRKRFDTEVEEGAKRLRASIDDTIRGKVNEALQSALGLKK